MINNVKSDVTIGCHCGTLLFIRTGAQQAALEVYREHIRFFHTAEYLSTPNITGDLD